MYVSQFICSGSRIEFKFKRGSLSYENGIFRWKQREKLNLLLEDKGIKCFHFRVLQAEWPSHVCNVINIKFESDSEENYLLFNFLAYVTNSQYLCWRPFSQRSIFSATYCKFPLTNPIWISWTWFRLWNADFCLFTT